MPTPTELRLKIVQLRMRFLHRTDMQPEEEERVLAEIETLNGELRTAERGAPGIDPAERRWARRIQVDLPCRYVPLHVQDPEALSAAELSRIAAPDAPAWKSATQAEIVNVSRTGLLLSTTESIRPGMLFWILLSPGPAGMEVPRPFSVRTTVVRSVFEGRRYLVGLEWTALSEAEISELERFLRASQERAEGALHDAQASFEEKRRHPRHAVAVPLKFMILKLPPMDRAAHGKVPVVGAKRGEGRDVSKGGILFITEIPLLPGTSLSVEVTGPGEDAPLLRVRGEVVRSTHAKGKNFVGFRFTDPDEVEARLLSELVQRYSA